MIEKIIQKVGDFCSWLSFALVILITLDVFLRYVFNFSSASLYELEWHFFAIIFLLGSSITLQKDEHVRVDVFYSKFSEKKKQIINLLGNVFFLLPFSLVIFIPHYHLLKTHCLFLSLVQIQEDYHIDL